MIDGETIVIGAANDDDLGIASGSARVFRYDGNRWIEERKPVAADSAFSTASGGASMSETATKQLMPSET